MNLAFIEKRVDESIVSPQHTAVDGLTKLGYETRWFSKEDFKANKVPITKDTLVVGYIETYRESLRRLGVAPPSNIDYPDTIPVSLIGRKIWKSALQQVRESTKWPVFVKPMHEHKAFTGRVFAKFSDLLSSSAFPGEMEVWCSEPVEFLSEYRCFLFDGQVVGCRHYKGDPLVFPDPKTIAAIAEAWTDAPIACCFDVGVVNRLGYLGWETKTLLVEVNDGHSMGDYGLISPLYARMIEARWCQLTGATPIP